MITVVSTITTGAVEINSLTADQRFTFDPTHVDGSPCLMIGLNPKWTGLHVVYQNGVEIWRIDLGPWTDKIGESYKSFWARMRLV